MFRVVQKVESDIFTDIVHAASVEDEVAGRSFPPPVRAGGLTSQHLALGCPA